MAEDTKAPTGSTNEGTSHEDEEKVSLPELRLTMDKRIEFAIFVVVILLGVFLIVEARNIDEGLMPDPVTSRGMPLIIGVSFIVGGIILALMRLMTWSLLPGNFVLGEGHEDEEGHPASFVRAFSVVLAAWLSVWLLRPVGYLIATSLFMFVALWIMGKRSWLGLIGLPVIYTLVTWYVFSQPLQVILPLGFMRAYFRSLGLTP